MGTEKDGWDKARIGAFIAIPLVLAYFGHLTNVSLKEKDLGVRMVELAVGILKEDPQEDKTKTPNLRQWAIDIIDEYSKKVKLTKDIKEELKEQPLPKTVTFGGETSTMTVGGLGTWTWGGGPLTTEELEKLEKELEKLREEDIKP